MKPHATVIVTLFALTTVIFCVFLRLVSSRAPVAKGRVVYSDHEEPDSGCEPRYEFVRKYRRTRENCISVEERFGLNHYFRVRTKVDDDGSICSAHYGKMYGDFLCHFDFEKRIRVQFKFSRRDYRQANLGP